LGENTENEKIKGNDAGLKQVKRLDPRGSWQIGSKLGGIEGNRKT